MNTKFFHRTSIAEKERSRFTKIDRADGTKTKNMDEMKKEAMNFFETMLNTKQQENKPLREEFLNAISNLSQISKIRNFLGQYQRKR